MAGTGCICLLQYAIAHGMEPSPPAMLAAYALFQAVSLLSVVGCWTHMPTAASDGVEELEPSEEEEGAVLTAARTLRGTVDRTGHTSEVLYSAVASPNESVHQNPYQNARTHTGQLSSTCTVRDCL